MQSKILRNIANVDFYTSNAKVREKLNIKTTIWDSIKQMTDQFYNLQIKKNETLSNIAIYNHQNAPFKIKYKLPHQILIQWP